jgi:hypothetical protein
MNKIGKMLYPRLDRWQRRREIKRIMAAVLSGLFFAGIVGLMMILKNHSPH